MSIRLYYLWSKVFGRPAERPGMIVYNLSEAKVCPAEVPTPVEQKVLGLEATVNNIGGVEIFECKSDSCKIKMCHVGSKPLCAT